VTRFLTVAALTMAMVLVAVQSLGILFLTNGAPDLLLLCGAAGLCSLPVILSRLPDWACWLTAQLLAAAGALWLADRPVGLTEAISNLPNTGLALALPGQFSSRAIALNFGGHSAIWMLLLLLGLLTWELTWGVLWLVLRAGYVWPAILLAGANLLTAASVGTDAQTRFLPFVMLSLLLVLWHTWSERWTRAGAEPGVHLPFRWAAISLLGGLCVLGLALPLGWTLAPSMQNGNLRQWATARWTRLQPSLVNPLHLSTSSDGPTLGAGGFGDEIALAGPFRPFPGVIMRVQGVPPDQGPYWRGQVYGEYSGGTWRMAGSDLNLSVPGGDALPADVPRHNDRLLTVHITVTQPAEGLLFAPGRPVAASVPVRAVYPDPDVSGSEPGALYASGPLQAGDVYTMVAETPFATPRLDAAGPSPDPRYSVIPPGLDPRLSQLALKLTAGLSSPLAKARAITNYLRGPLFTYDSSVGAPPNGQDPLTYFLFTSRRGYCVHFASSMALLARLAGLPSRVVGGYVTGAYENGSWVVRGENAHTWPEIFFTGVGWVPFEPTPGFVSAPVPAQHAVGVAPTKGGALPSAQPTKSVPLTPPPPAPHGGSSSTSLFGGYAPLAGLIAALAAVLGGGALWLRALRRRRPTIADIYRRLCRTATLLARGPRPWHTPFEFAHFYVGRSAEEYADITRITTLYAVTTYAHARAVPSPAELIEAREALRRLRRRWLARKLHLRRS
jgi:transglutaminase-like putative cysteine protease